MSKLTEARDVAGLKPSFVAEKLGISYSQFNRLENGISKLDKLKIEKLSQLYKIDIKKITQIAEESFKKRLCVVNDLMNNEEVLHKKLENLKDNKEETDGVTN